MQAWLLTIEKNYPQHWEYAKEHGMWDLLTHRNITAGDVVYYWQSGQSLLGKVRAIEDAHAIDIAVADPGPWDDWPGTQDKPYASRFRFEVIVPDAQGQPTWTEVHEATGLTRNPSWVRTVSPEQQIVLDDFLGSAQRLDPQQSLDDQRREEILSRLSEDMRVRRTQLVALRQGQQQFRGRLLDAYDGRCAITRTAIPSVLEAAHIAPYQGTQSNLVQNGLLLRADLHTLFDVFLLTVEASSLQVRLSPDLVDSEYHIYDNMPLTTPQRLDEQPLQEALREHNAQCGWL